MIPAWKNQASCQDAPAALFDPVRGDEGPTARAARVNEAALICGRCPVRTECLTTGVQGKESGVWGGFLLDYGKRHRDPATRNQHGTYYSYRRHLNRGEVPCADCRRAYAEQRRNERTGAA